MNPSRSQPEQIHFPRWQRFARVLWILYAAALVALVCWLAVDPDRWNQVAAGLDSPVWIVTVLSHIGLLFAGEFLLSLGLGFLTAASLAPARTKTSWIKYLFGFVVAFLFSFVGSFVLRTIANGAPWVPPSIVSLLWLMVGCGWGSWLGAGWIGSRSTIGWGFRQLLTAATVVSLGACAFWWMCLSPERSVERPEKISTAERRQLVNLFQRNDPRELEPDETGEVTLTQEQTNQFANWGLSLLPGNHAARIHLLSEEVTLEATIELPVSALTRRYVNLTIGGRPLVRAGDIGFSPRSVRMGGLGIPSALLQISGPLIVSDEWRNESTRPFLSSLEQVTVSEKSATVTYRHMELEDGFVSDTLVGLGVVKDLQEATAVHVENLIQTARDEPRLTFSDCVEAAFREARRRSRTNSAVDENRAAMMALACVLGPSEVRQLAGQNIPEPPPEIRSRFRRVTLSGRRDWAKHFIVSAALKVLSNDLVSLDVGVLKEELDADGGSGFSFGDLLADRAGTMFAKRSTESESAAKDMQRRIVAGFVEADFIPAGDDLPEGLSDRQLQTQYGGVDGAGYNELLQEIDRRIENCRAYRD